MQYYLEVKEIVEYICKMNVELLSFVQEMNIRIFSINMYLNAMVAKARVV